MAFLEQLLVGIVLQVIGYMLTPKPKKQKPPTVEDMKSPTAEAGRPIPVVFGSITVKSPNLLWMGDKAIRTRKANAGGKK